MKTRLFKQIIFSDGTKASLLALFVFMVCSSCIKVQNDEVPITLSVSSQLLSYSSSGEQQIFTIYSNDGWYVRSNSTWLTISSSTGSNSATITATATANTAQTQREAIITVSCWIDGVPEQKIRVIQSGASYTAYVRFQKDGAYSLYTQMAIANTSQTTRYATYYFGTSSGTSPYYEVPTGTLTPLIWNTTNAIWQPFYWTDGSGVWTVVLVARNRYTIRLYYDSTGYHSNMSETN